MKNEFDQLVKLNYQDWALTLLAGCEDWLDQTYKTEEDHLNIEKLTALIGFNAYIQETCAE